MIKSLDTLMDLVGAGFKPMDQAKPRHFAALGRFAVTISNKIDIPLLSCLLSQVDVTQEGIANIIVGGLPIGDVMGALRRIAELIDSDRKLTEDMSILFDEINNLRNVRNNVLHRSFMVKGNKFAFHNTLYAKTDSHIDVSFYSLEEIQEFTNYACHLGLRIAALSGRIVPGYTSPRKLLLWTTFFQTLQIQTMIELRKVGKISDEDYNKLLILSNESDSARKQFAEAVEKIDDDYPDIQKRLSAANRALSAALSGAIAPADLASLEIPVRLRKKDRTPQVRKAQVRLPRPRSSPK
jgi:hypothetical protein